eukprot:100193_1
MSDAEVLLLNLVEIPLTERQRGIKLLSKILENIILHENDPKYGDLKYTKVKLLFIECKPCFDLLFCAGFKQSIDNKRLIWKYNNDNLNKLKHIIHIITISNHQTTFDDKNDILVDIGNNCMEYTSNWLNNNKINNRHVSYHCDLSQCLPLTIITNILITYKQMGENICDLSDIFNTIGDGSVGKIKVRSYINVQNLCGNYL